MFNVIHALYALGWRPVVCFASLCGLAAAVLRRFWFNMSCMAQKPQLLFFVIALCVS